MPTEKKRKPKPASAAWLAQLRDRILNDLRSQDHADRHIAETLAAAKRYLEAREDGTAAWLAWCEKEFGWGKAMAYARLDPKQMIARRQYDRERAPQRVEPEPKPEPESRTPRLSWEAQQAAIPIVDVRPAWEKNRPAAVAAVVKPQPAAQVDPPTPRVVAVPDHVHVPQPPRPVPPPLSLLARNTVVDEWINNIAAHAGKISRRRERLTEEQRASLQQSVDKLAAVLAS